MKSISLFVDNGTYLTKVHPFTKLMYIAAAISIPLITGKLWMFGVFIAVSLCVLASGKILKIDVSADRIFFYDPFDDFPDPWIVQPEKRECAVSDRRAEILQRGHTLRPPYRFKHSEHAAVLCSVRPLYQAV